MTPKPTGGVPPGANVLVVDDESLIRWSLGQSLKGAGYRVCEAADGRQALAQCAAAGPFDLLVLDYRLPDTDGLRLLEQLRQVMPDCPCILMTAYSTPETVDHARRLGVHTLVSKPFDVEEMARLAGRAMHPA